MRHLFLFSLLGVYLYASEPSVFGAGNLNNPNPYGLTHEEKLILESNKKIEKIAHKNSLQTAKVESVSERLDGIQAVVEGLSQSSNEQKIALMKLTEVSQEGNTSKSIETLSVLNKTNSDNLLQLKALVEELSKVVDSINSSYVGKEEFALLMKQLKVAIPTGTTDVPKKMDNLAIEKEAKKLFDAQKYSEAEVYYAMMIQKKYKQAEASFWIGECYFEQKKYKEAVGYYKQSASFDEKSSVMPTLLLHSGISLEKMGDKDKAKTFYNATISRYGSTGAATEAKVKLAKLK
jgi:TolA-binding protein